MMSEALNAAHDEKTARRIQQTEHYVSSHALDIQLAEMYVGKALLNLRTSRSGKRRKSGQASRDICLASVDEQPWAQER